MKFTVHHNQLLEAAKQGIISQEQAQRLWLFLQQNCQNLPPDKTDTPISKFLYYFGAIIVIGAMGWFMNTTWEQFGGFGLFSIAALYAICFVLAGRHFKSQSPTLSGLLYIVAVCMTPLATYGLQKGLGIWPKHYPGYYSTFHVYVKSGWFVMEITTLLSGLLALRYVRIPFVTAPIAFTLWYMSMDIAPILYGPDYHWAARKIVSIVFGLAMLACAFAIDRRKEIDYAKWLYIFGSLTFWTGLTLMNSQSELSKFLYCLLNAFFIFVGILLERKVFTVFGALGVFGYIGHLAWTVFRNSLLFPFALSGVGIALIFLGWLYHKQQDKIIRFAYSITPSWIIRNLPQNRQTI